MADKKKKNNMPAESEEIKAPDTAEAAENTVESIEAEISEVPLKSKDDLQKELADMKQSAAIIDVKVKEHQRMAREDKESER